MALTMQGLMNAGGLTWQNPQPSNMWYQGGQAQGAMPKPRSYVPPGEVKGAIDYNTGGTGGGSTYAAVPAPTYQPTPQMPTGPSQLDLIRSRLDEVRRTAGDQIRRAGENKDYLLNYVKDQYGNLRNRADERLQSQLGVLDQEGTRLDNTYERARGGERRRTANAETANRMRARALNRLDSSFYDDIQATNTADMTRALGTLDLEEADKEAALGTRRTDTNQYFNEVKQDLDAEQSQMERQAIQEYQEAVAKGEALERAGVLDFGEGVAQANAQLQSRLDGINSHIQNMQLQQMQLASQVAAAGGNINSFNAMNSNLQSQLADNGGLNSVLSRAYAMLGSPTTQGVDMNALMALSRRPDELMRV